MNIETRFRAWDGKKMYYWDSVDHPATHLITNTPDKKLFYLPMSWLLGDSNDWVWMQYTGLKDKNGKEIYESDKVRILYTNWSSQHLVSEELQKLTLNDYKKAISDNGVIVWRGDRWQVEFDGISGKEYGSIFPGTHGEIEVIGNLYENSELLNNKN